MTLPTAPQTNSTTLSPSHQTSPLTPSSRQTAKMVDIVPLSSYPSYIDLLPSIQTCNITNLPENYFLKYYLYHALTWPQLSFVAVDTSPAPQASPAMSQASIPRSLDTCLQRWRRSPQTACSMVILPV